MEVEWRFEGDGSWVLWDTRTFENCGDGFITLNILKKTLY